MSLESTTQPINFVQRAAAVLQDSYRASILFLAATVVALNIIGYIFRKSFFTGDFFLLVLLSVLFSEVVSRIIFRMAYGKEYRYAIFNYILVDDADYGVALRKNLKSKSTPFLLFDKIVFPQGTQRVCDPTLNKEYRTDFNVNSLGFRGKEFSSNHKTSRMRIFCSGGSTTAGVYDNDFETWPAKLQEYFQKSGYDVEVINAGVDGWYSYQEYLRFDKEICHYHADILLLHQGWNEEFEYSSLSLGRKWKPDVARNVLESNYLYCPPNRFLSQKTALSLFFYIRYVLKKFVFMPNMSFSNPKRWGVLLQSEYILAWYENLLRIARLAHKRQVLVYTVDCPALVDVADSPSERNSYIQGSRLTPLFADYQAISKKRISKTLQRCNSIIPCIQTEDILSNFKDSSRLALFSDEIHLNAAGDDILANSIARYLISNSDFQARYSHTQGEQKKSNVGLDHIEVERTRATLKKNPSHIDSMINEKIEQLRLKRQPIFEEVPDDRYTTF